MGIWHLVNGPYGSLALTAAGILWLTAVALWPSRVPSTPAQLALPPSPIIPSFAVPTRLALAKEIDLHVEVLDIVFKEHPTGALGILSGSRDGWYMLFQLRITNRGTSDATVTGWELQPIIGSRNAWFTVGQTSLVQIPRSWYIEKPPIHYGANPEKIEIERPTLDQRTEHEPLKPRIPQTGWVLFDLSMPGDICGPYNAEYDFKLRDSMGDVHEHKELPTWTTRSGEIKYAPASEEIGKGVSSGDEKK